MTAPDFSVAEILAWARTKPADEAYDYWGDRCAVGQFLVETGRATNPQMCCIKWYEDAGSRVRHEFDPRIDKAARVQTFGAFADRLEALTA